MKFFLKKYWFTIGLIFAFSLPLFDFTGYISGAGRFLKNNSGPDIVIVLIFLCSGLSLDAKEVKSGIKDFFPVVISLFLIFVVSPFIAWIFIQFPLSFGISAGLAVVSVMPTTLSSGVVMTAAAGGNKAQALLITVCASFIAVFTIPFSLKIILGNASVSELMFDPFSLMISIGLKVILPLAIGYGLAVSFKKIRNYLKLIQILSQLFILVIVWISASAAENIFLTDIKNIIIVILIVLFFHVILTLAGWLFVILFKIGKKRRESVIFMGGQKTLPLSLIVQVSVFPELGLALAVCVMHHLVQLIYDSFMQAKMSSSA
ncbi:MAG: bile acid:sodium symporter [Thermodesulfobacteriota bacterium]